MSIQVYVKNKALINFEDEVQATAWIESNPDLPDYTIYSDRPMDDFIIAIPEVKNQFNCINCRALVGFVRKPEETKMNVLCPNCGTLHAVTAPDVSTPSSERDEP